MKPSRTCASSGSSVADRRATGTFTCRYCGHTEQRHSPNHVVCDRAICRKRQKLAQNWRHAHSTTTTYVGARQRKVRHASENSKYGPRIIEPLGPPRCFCGEPLKFGSDPRLGTSIEWCHIHGERPLPRYGEVHYDQQPKWEGDTA